MFLPYAPTTFLGRKAFKVCPACSKHIPLKAKKDFESFSGKEYADHFEKEHPEQMVTLGG